MKVKNRFIILALLGIIVGGILLVSNNDQPLIEYSESELAWLEDHPNYSVYYYIDGDIPDLFDEIIITLEMILKMDFVETKDLEIVDAKNGIIFSMSNNYDDDNIKTRTIYTSNYGIYCNGAPTANLGNRKLGVLKDDLKHLDFTGNYDSYDITEINTNDNMLMLIENDVIDCFVTKGNFPVIIDNEGIKYTKVNELYSKDENLVAYVDKNQIDLHQILNKGINHIRYNNILDNIIVSEFSKRQIEIFQELLTEEEKQWITKYNKVNIGINEKAPTAIKIDQNLFGSTIGIIEQFSLLAGVDVEYIYGEKEELKLKSNEYNIDILWIDELDIDNLETLPFIKSNYVVVSVDHDIEFSSRYDLQHYNLGMVFESEYTATISDELGNSNIEFYKDEDALVENLVEENVEVIILSKNTFDYYEKVKGYHQLDLIFELEDTYESSLIVLNQDEILKSILDKVILLQDLELLESTSLDDIPVEETLTYADFIWLFIIVIVAVPGIAFILIRMYINAKETQQMNYLFTHDQLTHLPNKYGLQHYVDDLISKNSTIALMLIDIDNLKDVNDRLGHLYGDQIIVEYSQKLLGVLDKNIILGRSGGDEFVIVSQDISEEAINKLVKEIKYHTEEFKNSRKELYNYSVSIAITTYPNQGLSYNELYKYAEYTLDYVKSVYGPNSELVFTYDIYDNYVKEQKMIKEIKQGLANDEFVLYIQPQVELPSEKVIGGEVLVRWEHPILGTLYPDTFIPVAEKNGLIRDLDYYILHKSCEYVKDLQTRINPIKVSVNMSTTTFEDDDLIETIKSKVESLELNTESLTIEVTEDMGFHNMEKAKTVFKAIRELGISVALDDFGKGYSSLAYLEKLTFDILKIDKVFIDNIHIRKESYEIFKTITSLAENMGIKVVAEGVEISDQLEILKERNNIVVQGYYYSKPMAIELFEEFIQNRQK